MLCIADADPTVQGDLFFSEPENRCRFLTLPLVYVRKLSSTRGTAMPPPTAIWWRRVYTLFYIVRGILGALGLRLSNACIRHVLRSEQIQDFFLGRDGVVRPNDQTKTTGLCLRQNLDKLHERPDYR